MTSTFKSAVGGLFLAAGLAFSGAASAGITLDTTGLKADATLQFSTVATNAAAAAKVTYGPLGNTVELDPVTIYDAESEADVTVQRFAMPVTKAKVSIGWDLKITANSGESSRSALNIKRGTRTTVLANFSIDFDKQIVYADAFVNGANSGKIEVYTFDVVEPQKISFKNLVLNQSVKIGNLKFTQSTSDLLGNGLGLPAILQAQLAALDYGTISVLVTSYKRSPKTNATPFTLADIPQ